MTAEGTAEDDFECFHCEASGKASFSFFKRQQENAAVKVWVKNIPEGLTQQGIKNLFLTVGTPLCISFNARNNSALVTFEFLNQAELAVRDLNCQPPYYLKVTISSNLFRNEDYEKREADNFNTTDFKPWDFSVEENPVEGEVEEEVKNVSEIITQIRQAVSSLGYDPSIRMRQRFLDFKTSSRCVSVGRGYTYMGKDDRFVAGPQKQEFMSQNSNVRDRVRFYCENCKAQTTKFCGNCNATYCSKFCLNNSPIDHYESCSHRNGKREEDTRDEYSNVSNAFPPVPFTSGCTVVLSFYSTMKTVFVRRTDGPWGERFVRLCNEVAREALKGGRLEKAPEEGVVVAAKYYEDLCFYRAKVLSAGSKKVWVCFIDFGNTQETDADDLRPLPEHLQSVPEYAAQVQLKDVSDESSLDSVDYYNKLTAEEIPLIMNFENSTDEVVLVENDTKTIVNEAVSRLALPSWKRSGFSVSKLDIYYLDSLRRKVLEVSSTFSLVLSHFDEKEFSDCDVFWVTHPETDDFFHVTSKMRLEMTEYCQFLKGECYLPRENELCLAKENDEWHRCVSLQSLKTTCCLFFLDDGHSSSIETKNIRRMIEDFTEAPSQAVCCVLPGHPMLKTNEDLRSRVVEYLKGSAGQRIDSVRVLKLVGDAYCLSIPRVNEILNEFKP